MSDLMREEFENAFVARCTEKGRFPRLDRFDDGRYEYLDASDAWWGWQASRECLVIELPRCYCADPEAIDYTQSVVEHIESLGLKVKP